MWLDDQGNYIYFIAYSGLFSLWKCIQIIIPPRQDSSREICNSDSEKRKKNCMSRYKCTIRIKEFYLFLKGLMDRTGISGDLFWHFIIAKENSEGALQFYQLLRYAAEEDASLNIATASILLINSAGVGFFLCNRRGVVVSFDAITDIMYIVLNGVRLTLSNTRIDMFDMLAFTFPVVSVTRHVSKYAALSVEEKNEGEKAFHLHRLRMVLLLLLVSSAFVFGGVSVYILASTITMHNECQNIFSECVWEGAWPRKYYNSGSIFGEMDCGEGRVESIDAQTCRTPLLNFKDFAMLTSLHLGQLTIFPKSLLHLMESPDAALSNRADAIFKVEQLPEDLDLSNLQLRNGNLPRPMINMLKEYATKRGMDVREMNLRGNIFGSKELFEVLNAVGCHRNVEVRESCNVISVDVSAASLSSIPSLLFSQDAFPQLNI